MGKKRAWQFVSLRIIQGVKGPLGEQWSPLYARVTIGYRDSNAGWEL